MDRRKALAAKRYELEPLLQLRFWKPLRNLMQVFPVLPLAAAAICFILLATDAQFREIYISYLEIPRGGHAAWITGFVAAALVLFLLSTMLYESYFALSTLRIGIVYSGYSNPDARSSPHVAQRTAAFVLAFSPWLGIAVGLFNARNFVAERYCFLLSQMPSNALHGMQHLWAPRADAIAAALVFLGASTATFSCADQKARIAQRTVALLTQPLAILLFLLFTDWLILDITDWRALLACAVALLLTVGYFVRYQSLYAHRRGPFFRRVPIDTSDELQASLVSKVPKGGAQFLLSWIVSSVRGLINRQESTGVSFGKRQRYKLVVWAIFPWLVFAGYFLIAPHLPASGSPVDQWAQSQSGPARSLCPLAGTFPPLPGPWAIFPLAMCCVIALGLFTCLFLNTTGDQRIWRGIVIRRRFVFLAVVVVMAVAAKLLSLFGADAAVSFYRLIGPLAAAALQLLFLITAFAVLAWLSQRSGFPVLTLVIVALVACVMFPNHIEVVAILLGLACAILAVLAFFARYFAVGAVALLIILLGATQWLELRGDRAVQNKPGTTGGMVDPLSVKLQYECWLRQRGIAVSDGAATNELERMCPVKKSASGSSAAAGGGGTYPVYIIAAEGGGIYAASAASILLGRLQDDSPHFSRHVFAISGVSGGAIGSTVFEALEHAASEKAASASADGACASSAANPQRTDKHALERKAEHVMKDDHFSPVVGSIFPELTASSAGRAEALVASFDDSVSTCDAAAGEALRNRFTKAWSFDGPAPALVLNSTWVETGFRVAFAPFRLHGIDEALYSFSDPYMPDESRESLMGAAAVSARFPLILPPFSAAMPVSAVDTTTEKRWNFVDGGYSDNSGATTALDLYKVLKSVAAPGVDVRIILLTSSHPQPNLSGGDIDGTAFRDTMGPIEALMSVRRDLGNEAVALACSEIYSNEANSEKATGSSSAISGMEANEQCNKNGDPSARLQIVEIQDQTYGLSLGWKISQNSFDVVSWMLGKPDECPTDRVPSSKPSASRSAGTAEPTIFNSATPPSLPSHGSDQTQPTMGILERNSCVLQSIVKAVGD